MKWTGPRELASASSTAKSGGARWAKCLSSSEQRVEGVARELAGVWGWDRAGLTRQEHTPSLRSGSSRRKTPYQSPRPRTAYPCVPMSTSLSHGKSCPGVAWYPVCPYMPVAVGWIVPGVRDFGRAPSGRVTSESGIYELGGITLRSGTGLGPCGGRYLW